MSIKYCTINKKKINSIIILDKWK